ncbi:hypothetical protein [Yoonia sediminilitoris]|uniref:Uncharacterized protein n=1 Tax=Yoonia sediminilitoris TaxID=1286148 RepID=A0A2T6K9Y6_9RHOB|nr:hypothetical protein [Yoonia sediminilitoris]PUB11555.1 hypothetical protein C8N45_11373 [Yoonia sediminilitoris]RCW91755.1 hypothetical protein DFP92_11373 [Yoonia sediminilitoris]
MKELLVQLPPQDVIALMSSLRLGSHMTSNPQERDVIAQQVSQLQEAIDAAFGADSNYAGYLAKLSNLDMDLHTLEADLQRSEAQQDFGAAFIALTRSFLALRTQRAALMAEIATELS